MERKTESIEFAKTCRAAVVIIGAVIVAAVAVAYLFPAKKVIPFTPSEQTEVADERVDAQVLDVVYHLEALQTTQAGDDGLALYRNPRTRAFVEKFYTDETKQSDVATAILEQADKYDVPLSLAFALAHAESRYSTTARNYNSNGTVDRGLFQLNSNSFPNLSEADFFNAATSARYGMSHLRFCLDNAGNVVAALAMYNAGTAKVRSNGTPRRTLNYIDDIMTYRQMLDRHFDDEVMSFRDTVQGQLVAMATKE